MLTSFQELAGPDQLWQKTQDNDGSHNTWYQKAVSYWDHQDASYDGVLGGHAYVSDIDVRDSRQLLEKVGAGAFACGMHGAASVHGAHEHLQASHVDADECLFWDQISCSLSYTSGTISIAMNIMQSHGSRPYDSFPGLAGVSKQSCMPALAHYAPVFMHLYMHAAAM